MPVESGPTTFLPYSQTLERNYLTWRNGAFKEHYEGNFVQLALAKGDAVFFNPGLVHAAGDIRDMHEDACAPATLES